MNKEQNQNDEEFYQSLLNDLMQDYENSNHCRFIQGYLMPSLCKDIATLNTLFTQEAKSKPRQIVSVPPYKGAL